MSDEKEVCVHCGTLLAGDIGDGLFAHANGRQRCQSSEVPYGHMGHPDMPCPPGEVNPCRGYFEERGECTHIHADQSDGGAR